MKMLLLINTTQTRSYLSQHLNTLYASKVNQVNEVNQINQINGLKEHKKW